MADFEILKNFTYEELACPETGKCILHPGFAKELQRLRDAIDAPIYVSSCCRSQVYNASLPNSSRRSLHIYDFPDKERGNKGTLAIDVRVVDSVYRLELIKIGLLLGWSGYVMHGGNVHLDQRVLLGEPQIWWAAA